MWTNRSRLCSQPTWRCGAPWRGISLPMGVLQPCYVPERGEGTRTQTH